jgi:hypothetical protein
VVVSKPFVIHRAAKSTSTRTGEIDIAARYFVYKLFDATGGDMALWPPVRLFRETQATISRAVERGWVVIRDEVSGKAKQRSVALTEKGRLLARKSLR